MNLRDMEYVVAVAETLHFGRAAERCHVSQPSLSMQIKKAEDMLGVQIFERTNKQVLVTAAGKEIVTRARVILKEFEAMKHMADIARDPMGGPVRLGVIPTMAPYLLPKTLPKLRKALPRVKLTLLEGQTHIMVQQLNEGALDIVLLALPIHDDRLHEAPIFEEAFLLAVPHEHALAAKKQVQISDLEEVELMLLEDGHCLRDQALEVCHKAGAMEQQNFRATSLETLRQMVASGAGITLIPEQASGIDTKHVTYIPFAKAKPHRTVGFLWRKSTPRTALFEAMQKLFKDVFAG